MDRNKKSAPEHDAYPQLSDEYKLMMDKMLDEEERGEMKYASLEHIKNKFQR
ncbi:hypothetical protein [Mucilaginibacter psychrotolerans]|uniref:hypothetical protein n=1 Tax=Mucilaginibacter psychrotolerans TaxID=1524096 RepID=UPI00130532CF|nr:hypothetical protein [Mucilaginibacter psychrotolerans]